MPKRYFLLALFLVWFAALDALAGYVEVAKVRMPQLNPLQWESLRQQQGGHFQQLRIDVHLAVDHGKVYSVSVRRGTGHDDIDKTIVKWITANWKTYPWFAGGDSYVISMNVDPAIRQIVFRKT
ncbi:MAG: hypothetical protein JOZ08_03175 [Verrucomicrobia bacterium]|nr:hypothetical protein [Verrucomicrobiota bacterium]MBV8279338.1 hypothetical protein [Verrucomicrobiota bacterium]